jgi:gliding motility-associated-like protein
MLPAMLRFLFVFLFCTGVFFAQAQTCTALGQNPQTAFPVCGTSVFTQNTVPFCGNRNIVSPCGANAGLTDKNPYWYKFTCFSGGTLGFIITPFAANEDYDWQLFDVTNVTNLDLVYTNLSLFVACNWSATYGPTGASAAGTVAYTCGGAIPLLTLMPTLIAGHNYLLLVSHYDSTPNGYTLSFGGGTANITDTLTSHIIQATAPCDGTTINVKLNKKMRCASLAANGSDFQLNTTAVNIIGATGFGCSTGFDLDSLQLTLSGPLPAGTYRLKAKVGSDLNTLLDICSTPLAVGDSADFIVAAQAPVPMDSVRVAACSPQEIVLQFSDDIRCTSIAPDGSDFTVTGPGTVAVTGAVGTCNPNGLTRTITVSLANPIRVGGTYAIRLQNGTDGNTLFNNCLRPTPAGSTLPFAVRDSVSANFTFTVVYNPCAGADTVKFSHVNPNGITFWNWSLSGGQPVASPIQNQIATYTTPGIYNTTLLVSNGFCRDSVTLPVTINAVTRDTVLPKLASAIAPCEGTQILIKLNKKIRCSSIAANGSDFTISPASATISSATGVGCNSAGETDSLVLNLASGLPTGIYTLAIGNGSDGNTLVDVCGRAIPVGDSIRNIAVVSHPLVTMDSISKVGCKPIELFLVFKEPVRCSSIAANGSDFIVSGPSTVGIAQAAANTCTNGFTSIIKLTLNSIITVGGTYTITLNNGSDGNTLLNECNQPALPNLSRQFVAGDTVLAAFTSTVGYSCSGRDTVSFFHAAQNGVNQWRWNFDNGNQSTSQNPVVFYNTYGTRPVSLRVSNGFCADSVTQNIFIATDTLHASFEAPSFLCPGEPASIVNRSTGNIVGYAWDYGDGFTFSGAAPAVHTYATPTTQRDYPVKLTITGSLGCSVDTTATIKVLSNCVVAVPSGFTPNGDGLNDYLYPTNAYKADKLVFKVFNRFGQLIFEGRNATQKWDGKVNGVIQPTGTYVWFLNYTDTETGKAVSQKGTTVLIR